MSNKILYVGSFNKFWSTENYVAAALNSHGYKVIKHHNAQSSHARFMGTMRLHDIDFVIFSKRSYGDVAESIKYCKEQGIPTVTWLWDKMFGYKHRLPPHAYLTDLYYSTDGGTNLQYLQRRIENKVLRQGIPKSAYTPPIKGDPRIHIAFIGSFKGHPSRNRLLRWLYEKYRYTKGGLRFRHIQYKRGKQLTNVMSSISVVVGDSFPGDYYWSNRIYEITGRGGFLLHPYTVGLDSEFTDGKHYIGYERDNFVQLEELINHYVRAKDERDQIAEQGWRQCGNYTYENRVEAILRDVQSLGNGQAPTSPTGALPLAHGA